MVAGTLGCERCGRLDATLRYSVFTSVTSVVVFSSRKSVGGVWCDECRKKVGRKYAIRSVALGTWGFPWGVGWTAGAVGRGLSGGDQVKDANAVLLRAVGIELIHRGNLPEARRAFEASLNYGYDAEVYRWLQAYAQQEAAAQHWPKPLPEP
jgi:hypothetical protein